MMKGVRGVVTPSPIHEITRNGNAGRGAGAARRLAGVAGKIDARHSEEVVLHASLM